MTKSPEIMIPRGIERPVVSVTNYLDNFEPVEIEPDWSGDFSSKERQDSMANIVRLLEQPLSYSSPIQLRRIEIHGRKLIDADHTDSREHMVRIAGSETGEKPLFPYGSLEWSYRNGQVLEDMALKASSRTINGKQFDRWLIPISATNFVDIKLNTFQEGLVAPLIHSDSSRADIETALNKVGSYFQEQMPTSRSKLTLGERAALLVAKIAFRI